MHKLSTVIITLNEEKRIRQTLESVKWCDEIIVVDSGSTDKTLEICKEYSNCKVYSQVFLGFGPQKKFAVGKASHDWILAIDADEVVTNALTDEICGILSLPVIANTGFFIPITHIFMKRIFNHGAESKQPHLRFFNKQNGNFNTLKLHEGVEISGSQSYLKNEILHYSYTDIYHYFQKFNDYSETFKNEAGKNGKKAGKLMPVFRLPLEFLKQYFVRGNFMNGYPGLVWSLYSAFYIFVKYTKLYESNLKK
ncbi:MAG: glycosyltransferase family 2 protein [Bacteroidota bacterium]